MKISVIGSGTFGCALADHLYRNGCSVSLWGRDNTRTNNLIKTRCLSKAPEEKYLADKIEITTDIGKALESSDYILIVVPSPAVREVAKLINDHYINQVVVIATKGMEEDTHLTMDEVVKQEIVNVTDIAVLSGPTHAEEIIMNMPTACVVACNNDEISKKIQDVFMSDTFRLYRSDDVLGVELGGAIKNVIALAAGISDGIGYGDNAKAALITRGIVEISALGRALGAKAETFNGLTGLGDLIVTCQSIHSRNRMCGYYIGQGMSLNLAIEKVGMVVEGVNALRSIYEISRATDVETPIIDMIYNVLYKDLPVEDVAGLLINREAKKE